MDNSSRECSGGAGDKAGVRYWDGTYEGWNSRLFEPHPRGIRYLGRRKWHELFTRVFQNYAPRKGHLIEVGCGGSKYLPYFAKEFEFAVSGIDYSLNGCAIAEKNLQLADVKGNIYYGDVFFPPQELIETSDVAVSFGLVEHFSDTASCIAQIAHLVRPGGLIITIVPNIAGISGLAQKFLARDVYDKHISLPKNSLTSAHERSGLMVLEACYLEFMNFGVVNVGRTNSAGLPRSLRNLFHKGLLGVSLGVWTLEMIFGSFTGNSVTSPYVYCIAKKPGR